MGKLKAMLTKSHAAIQEKKEQALRLEAKIEQMESEMGATLDSKQLQIAELNDTQSNRRLLLFFLLFFFFFFFFIDLFATNAGQVEQLKLEIAEVSRSSVTTIEDLRRKLKTSETQLQESKDEYGQYKSRALSLFKDKAIDTNQAKIVSLENQVEALKKEARCTFLVFSFFFFFFSQFLFSVLLIVITIIIFFPCPVMLFIDAPELLWVH